MKKGVPSDTGTNLEDTDHIITQGRALVRAIEALETIEPSNDAERGSAHILVKAYRRRLRAIIGTAPAWVGNRILEASQNIGSGRAALFSDN